MRVGRIPYLNCKPIYSAIEKGTVPLVATLVDGTPTALNRLMADGKLDLSVVSAMEYAREPNRYFLLPDLAISCDGPVRSVLLFSHRPAQELGGQKVIVSKSSMTSVALLELLFENVWKCRPIFVPGDVESNADYGMRAGNGVASLVIGDAALQYARDRGGHGVGHKSAVRSPQSVEPAARSPQPVESAVRSPQPEFVYDLGAEWKSWTDLPFVFAVWVAQRSIPVAPALATHAALIESRNWGLKHIEAIAKDASADGRFSYGVCLEYFAGLDYGLSYGHLAGLSEFFRRLAAAGRVPNGTLTFLPAA